MSKRAFRFWCAWVGVGLAGESVFFREGPLSRFIAKVGRLDTSVGRAALAGLVFFLLPHFGRAAEALMAAEADLFGEPDRPE